MTKNIDKNMADIAISKFLLLYKEDHDLFNISVSRTTDADTALCVSLTYSSDLKKEIIIPYNVSFVAFRDNPTKSFIKKALFKIKHNLDLFEHQIKNEHHIDTDAIAKEEYDTYKKLRNSPSP